MASFRIGPVYTSAGTSSSSNIVYFNDASTWGEDDNDESPITPAQEDPIAWLRRRVAEVSFEPSAA